jgi:hypothetical protein
VATEHESADEWLHDVLRSARDEVMLFLRTLRDFLRTPSEFARRWVSGESRPMNPFAFVGVCLLVQAPLWFLLGRRLRPILDEAQAALQAQTGRHLDFGQWFSWAREPPVHYAGLLLLGIALHPFLRMCGAKRGFAATMGVVCYHAGLTTIINWLHFPYQYFYQYAHMREGSWLLDLVAALPGGIATFVYYVYAMSGAHALRRPRVALAIVLGFTTFIVVLGGVGIFLTLRYLKKA